jgi:hypothetical protein
MKGRLPASCASAAGRLLLSFAAYNLAPYECICKIGTSEPDRFILDPINQMPGLNNYERHRWTFPSFAARSPMAGIQRFAVRSKSSANR